MSSVYKEIRQAFEARLAATSSIPVIAWENVDYKPTTDTPFIKFMFQPTSRRPAVRGTNPQHRYQGICTLLVHYPENEGPGASQDTVDALIDRFESTTDMTVSGVSVTVDYAEQNSPYTSQPWFITPITIGWYSYN